MVKLKQIYLALGLILSIICMFDFHSTSISAPSKTNPMSPVETMIYTDTTLKGLDERLNKKYRAVMAIAANKKAIKIAQRKWLRDVRNICTDTKCLENAYRKRLGELSKLDDSGFKDDDKPSAGKRKKQSRLKKCWKLGTDENTEFYNDTENGLHKEFERVLNDSCEPIETFICNWTLPPTGSKFQKPKWEALDYRPNWLLIKDLTLISLNERYRGNEWRHIEPMIRKRFEKGHIQLETTKLDVDQNGEEEILVRSIDTPYCRSMGNMGVLDQKTGHLDSTFDNMFSNGISGSQEIILYNGLPYLFTYDLGDNFIGVSGTYEKHFVNLGYFHYTFGKQLTKTQVESAEAQYAKSLEKTYRQKKRELSGFTQRLTGDLNNDEKDDVALIYYGINAKSERFSHLAAFVQTGGALKFVDGIELDIHEDNVIRKAVITHGTVVLQGYEKGRDDLKYFPTSPYKKMYALKNGRIIEKTVSKPCSDGEPSLSKDQLLFQAAEEGNLDRIRSLIQNGADVNGKMGYLTPLVLAVSSNRLATVHLLLALGADPNLSDPLMIAIKKDTEIVRSLVKAGANVNVEDNLYKYTPLMYASGMRDDEFKKQKELNFQGPVPDCLETVRILVKAGANINHVDSFEATPLRNAVTWHKIYNIPMIRVLLDLGADVNQRREMENDLAGNTVLMKAVYEYCLYKKTDVIELLLKRGANPNEKNTFPYDTDCDDEYSVKCGSWNGFTVLTYAAYRGYYDVVKLLLKYGADPSLPRQDGKTAYQLAKRHGDKKMYDLLKKYAIPKKGPKQGTH